MPDDKTREFIAAHRSDDTRTLALQAQRYPGVDMRQAVTQIEGWQAARDKLPAWAATEGITYPPKLSMEQCSSEATALYKCSIAAGDSLADLTGGFGIDCSYLARGFKRATYIERNPLLCDIARSNFALLGLSHIEIINGNSEEQLDALPHQEWIYIDPARRDGDGRKVVALNECEPNVVELEQKLLEKSENIMVKCSPMLDITAATRSLPHTRAVHIVAVNNECKELLLLLAGGEQQESIPVHCTDIHKERTATFTFTTGEEEEATATYSTDIGNYLYEPNAAVQKAGCYRTLSKRLGVTKLHPNSQLYTADEYIADFPGRIFRVERVTGFSKSEVKKIQQLGRANITVRNFPESVQQLRKRLKLADGGDNYLFATTLAGGGKVLAICKKTSAPNPKKS